MKTSFTDAVLASAGKFYLQLRLGKMECVERELNLKYEGQYRNAGLMLLFDIFMAAAVMAIVGLVTVLLYYTTT